STTRTETRRTARSSRSGTATAPPRRCGTCRRASSGVPADLVVCVELAPERDLRLARDAGRTHHRLDLRAHLLEEAVEALRIRPLVDDHDLPVRPVEAVGDQSVLLGAIGDGAHRLG